MPDSKKKTLGTLAIAGVEPYQEKAGEEYMNDAQIAHFRTILEAWRNQLREEVDRTVTHMKMKRQTFLIQWIARRRKRSSALNFVTEIASVS